MVLTGGFRLASLVLYHRTSDANQVSSFRDFYGQMVAGMMHFEDPCLK
jgi:hypothetical protein